MTALRYTNAVMMSPEEIQKQMMDCSADEEDDEQQVSTGQEELKEHDPRDDGLLN